MRVNSFHSLFRSSTTKLLATVMIGFCTIFFLAAFISDRSEEDALSRKVNIAVRAIGHELLLRSGDKTSVIPPVVEKPNGVFVLAFENEFVFQPDTLVAIVQPILHKTGLSRYTVTVNKCHQSEIVYGFEIDPPLNSIEACRGRVQPKACYNIAIAFADFPGEAVLNPSLAVTIGGILLALAVTFVSINLQTKKTTPPTTENAPDQAGSISAMTIGKFVFETAHQRLKLGDEIIPLTDKECKVLTSLNRNINQLTLREELIQEIWTEEGVITGRSLDMFISKLRKKLSADPALRIANVHGKGYKLEIVNDAAFA